MSINTSRKRWTKEELALTLNLYCKLPFGSFHQHNSSVIKLATYLGRTPSSVAMKLSNFASLDPALTQKGLVGCSVLDKEMWNVYFKSPQWIEQSEKKIEEIFSDNQTQSDIPIELEDYSAQNVTATVKIRRMQGFFRKTILTNYQNRCCLTGIEVPELLVASHIVPWATDTENRLNPHNGLCLNALHDRAFDKGLITIDTDYSVVVSSHIPKDVTHHLLWDFKGQKIQLPERFLPSIDFLRFHQTHVFKE